MTVEFVVEGWTIAGSDVTFRYRSGETVFAEVVGFPVAVEITDVIARLFDLLAIVAGVSYAKAFAPATITFPLLDVSPAGLALIQQTYNEGMREFAFQNQLPLTSTFHVAEVARGENLHIDTPHGESGRPLIPFGAGRDSCVVASALKHVQPTLFTVGINPFAAEIARALSLPLLTASRSIDPLLIALNQSGVPNGHVPVTAINSLISLIVAELTGHTSVVMANEKSASLSTRIIDEVDINHQFSKSLEYEQSLRAAVDMAGSIVNYSSVLRSVPDYDISSAFATKCRELHHLFMSCNQAMLRDESRRSNGWCGDCPKCRGMFLSLAPFLSPQEMVDIFGIDLLNDDSQLSGFQDLMSNETKPFECVADVNESRESMRRLAALPQWSQHSIVRSCRDVSSTVTRSDSGSVESFTEFDAAIQRFVKASQ